MRKTQFPRLVIPLAVVLTALFNLGLNLVVGARLHPGVGVAPMWTWLLLPLVLAALVGLTTAVSMILSSLYPRFRDMAIIGRVLSTVLFYASPVLYPLEQGTRDARQILLQPARAAARAGAQVDRSTRRAGPTPRSRAATLGLLPALASTSLVCGSRSGCSPRGAADGRGAVTMAARAHSPPSR